VVVHAFLQLLVLLPIKLYLLVVDAVQHLHASFLIACRTVLLPGYGCLPSYLVLL
jgi:hypothetical protein